MISASFGWCKSVRSHSTRRTARDAGGRVRLLDLTRRFCGAARCYPVVGGVYVYKDDNHMNATFARTLGPFLHALMR